MTGLAQEPLEASSEERFLRAFEIETVGVSFFRIDGTIVDANDAFLKLVGLQRSDLAAGRVRWAAASAMR